MPENADTPSPARRPFDPEIQTEDIAFAPQELVTCECGRQNAPNRLNCLYCGSELTVDINKVGAAQAKLRPLEMWERGYNVVLKGVDGTDAVNVASVVSLLSMDADYLRSMIDMGVPLPLVRVESATEAAVVARELHKVGVMTITVSDDDLAPDKPPTRLSGIGFGPVLISLRAFNTGEVIEIPSGDLSLLVLGVIATGKVEAVEKKRRGKTEVLDEAATMSDEAVLDIYARGFPFGFRVNLSGFDFSCLSQEKELLAAANLTKLINALRLHAPDAIYIDNYHKVRHRLNSVWELDTKRSPTGLHRSFTRGERGSVTESNNVDQFTRYSRLQRHLT